MRRRAGSAAPTGPLPVAVLLVPVLLVAVLLLAVLAPGALAEPAPMATQPPSAPAGSRAVPPPAPGPTDSAVSPAAPDPHPPLGGRAPDGRAVGGAALLGRRLVLPAHAPALPDGLTARSWIVVDLGTGAVLAARDPHGRYQPASIQKLLTAVAVLPLLPGDRRVVVSKRAATTEGSHAGLVAGGSYTVDQLFLGLLLVSGNDAAEALAEAAGGRARTVARMNATARALGAYDTYVQTPSGLDGWQQLTSAYDMALVLRAALASPRIVAYDTVTTAKLPPHKLVGRVELDNQNEQFLTAVDGALLAKTGFTDAAQHTFVGAVERGGHRYGVVLLRAQRWPRDQWQQATALVKWASALPVGTAPVGRLESPAVRKPTPAPTPRTTPPTHGPSPAALRPAPTGGPHGPPVAVQILGLLAVLGGAGVLGRRLVRRR